MPDTRDRGEPDVLTCKEAIRLLARYLDDELGERSREKVKGHLRRCRSCYSRHEFEKGLKEQVTRLGHEPVKPRFRRRIRRLVSRFADGRGEEDEAGRAGEPDRPGSRSADGSVP